MAHVEPVVVLVGLVEVEVGDEEVVDVVTLDVVRCVELVVLLVLETVLVDVVFGCVEVLDVVDVAAAALDVQLLPEHGKLNT